MREPPTAERLDDRTTDHACQSGGMTHFSNRGTSGRPSRSEPHVHVDSGYQEHQRLACVWGCPDAPLSSRRGGRVHDPSTPGLATKVVCAPTTSPAPTLHPHKSAH